MRRASTPLIAVLALVWVAAETHSAAQGDPQTAAVKNPVAATPASVTAGQKLYQKYCRHCHGGTGRGDGSLAPKDHPPANLTDGDWVRGSSDGEIFAVISRGVGGDSPMKGMRGTLADKDIWNVVNYIHTLGQKAATP